MLADQPRNQRAESPVTFLADADVERTDDRDVESVGAKYSGTSGRPPPWSAIWTVRLQLRVFVKSFAFLGVIRLP